MKLVPLAAAVASTLIISSSAKATAPPGLLSVFPMATSAILFGSPQDQMFNVAPDKIKHLSTQYLEDGLVILTDDQEHPVYELPIHIPKDSVLPKNILLTQDWLAFVVREPGATSSSTLILAELPSHPISGGIPDLFPNDEDLKDIETWLRFPSFFPQTWVKQQLEPALAKIKNKSEKGDYLGESDMKADRRALANLFMEYLNRSCAISELFYPVRTGRPSVQEKELLRRYNESHDAKIASALNTIAVRDWLCANLPKGSLCFSHLFPTTGHSTQRIDGRVDITPEIPDSLPIFSAGNINIDMVRALSYRIYVIDLKTNYGAFQRPISQILSMESEDVPVISSEDRTAMSTLRGEERNARFREIIARSPRHKALRVTFSIDGEDSRTARITIDPAQLTVIRSEHFVSLARRVQQ